MNAPEIVDQWLNKKGWQSQVMPNEDGMLQWWTCWHYIADPMTWTEAVAVQMVLDDEARK